MINTSSDSARASSEFTAIWSAYVLGALGAVMLWPALIGVLVCLVKRDAPGAGFIRTHHVWLLRTFLWSLLALVACIGIVLAGVTE